MAEDAGVFFVARRIRRDFAEFEVILRVSRLLQDDAVLGGEEFVRGFEGARGVTIGQADASQCAEALSFNEDLSLDVFVGAYFAAVVVVSAEEPLAIPTVLEDGSFHLGDFGEIRGRFVGEAAMLGNLGEFAPREHQQAGDENGFGDLAVLVRGGLEGLARGIGEAVQVEAIIPISTTD